MDFVSKRRWFFLLSAIMIVPGVVFLIAAPGLKQGIDFTGGSSMPLRLSSPGEEEAMGVEYFVDPRSFTDPNTQDVTTITLSYTFSPAAGGDGKEDEKPQQAKAPAPVAGRQAKG